MAREEDGVRLDVCLERWLPVALDRPLLPRPIIRRLIVAGIVRVNGVVVKRPAWECRAGERIDAAIDVDRLGPLPTDGPPPASWHPQVIFEDEALIAVAKPPGLPTHATADPRRMNLYSALRQTLAGADPYLGVHHRLDVETSGVVVFTKLESANRALAAQFESRAVEKCYHALVLAEPHLPATWECDSRLALIGNRGQARMMPVATGGVRAVTRFVALKRWGTGCLVEAHPETGRKHQIRAHLAARGNPILGDERYGGARLVAGRRVPRTMLHALRIRLTHPLTGGPLEISAPYPEDFEAMIALLSGEAR